MAAPKIVLINRFFDPDDSATSQIATDLGRSLAARGREVHAVTSDQLYNDASARLSREQSSGGVRIHRVRTTRFGRAKLMGRLSDYVTFYAGAAILILKLAKKGDIVIVKTDPPLMSVVAGTAARLKGACTVNWLQDLFPEIAIRLGVRALSGPPGVFLTWLRNISVKSAAMNVIIDPAMAAHLPNSETKLSVIPNWADGVSIRPVAPQDNPLRSRLYPDNRFVVGYCGNFGRVYDFAPMLSAAKASREDPGIAWLLVGSGAQKERILTAKRDLALDNLRVEPYQSFENLSYSLSTPDLHFISTLENVETLMFPSKFYACLAAGRPVIFIGSPAHSFYRTILEADCGLAFPRSASARDLLDGIRTLRADPGKRAEMGQNARKIFEERYDKDRSCDEWNRLIGRVSG